MDRAGEEPPQERRPLLVRANAIPVMRNGEPQGYMSVRTKAPRRVRGRRRAYRAFREQGRPAPFHKGLVIRTGLRIASLSQTMSARARAHSALAYSRRRSLARLGMRLAGGETAAFAAVTAARRLPQGSARCLMRAR